MPRTSIFDMPFSKVYEALVNKAVKKGRTKAEVDEITCWLTGYFDLKELDNKTYGEFITEAPSWNTRAELITGKICGMQVEKIEDPMMKKALENGKHLLVEKSITLNSQELDEMIALAESKGLVLAEAMTIWHMPLYKELWSIVQSGELGRAQMITVNFGSFKEYNMANRFFNRNLAGGAAASGLVKSKSIAVLGGAGGSPAALKRQKRPKAS